jgi:uncharacterized protein with von Willebrand factor type A (vWA) domain
MSLPEGGVLVANAVRFGRLLHRTGLPVEPGQTRLFVEALGCVGLLDRETVRAAGRTIYVRRREEIPHYERAFALFWRRPGSVQAGAPPLPRIRQEASRPAVFPAPAPAPTTEPELASFEIPGRPAAVLASARERLGHADFATLTPVEAREALLLLETLRPALPLRRSARWRHGRHGTRPDLRRLARDTRRTGGEVVDWRWRRRRLRPRPLILITDISGSMEPYSRLMLRFAHAVARSGAPTEVFVFATRLTRITRQLRARDPDQALRRVADAVVDWNGGTRIGESLRELNRRWVRRTVRSGAVVLLVSDGWERGDPALLARETATLRRSCARLLWLDPLAARSGFAPEVAGLQAVLDHVDELIPCASVAGLTRLAARLRVLCAGARRTVVL